MITKLTPEQEARIPEFRDKWIKIGLSTEPANRPEAERGIRLAYECAGLKPPEEIVWCESPLAIAMIDFARNKSKNILARIWDVFRYPVGKQVDFTPIFQEVWASEKVQVASEVESKILQYTFDTSSHRFVWEHVRAQAWAHVLEQFWVPYENQARDEYWRQFFGPQHAHWLVFSDYLYHICSLRQQTHKLSGFWLASQTAGAWLPYRNVCFVSERHNILNLDDEGQLHCDDGLAVGYPDGWGVYARHGVRVPERVIMQPDTLTAEEIVEERNAEVRRIMIERIGMSEFIQRLGAQPVQSDDYGKLYRIDLKEDEPLVMVQVNDASTERQYFLRVPPHIQTAHEAVAWTFDMGTDEYKPDIET